MKKVLILTTSTGQGHNQAADSIIEAFNNTDFECIKHDFLIDNKIYNEVIVMGYEVFASKFPKLYGFFYNLTDKRYVNKSSTLVFLPVIRKLLRYIEKTDPDIIIG
ncbi:MAG: UDP-N-acetylglucosamine--LPS N-acetylglucosamine transferase, partial [Clostridium sp.]|nr:UDP-N-acetylglucosamine--LPS N-acetylglucosamine transferase [Clostridium sp.]